MLFFLNFVEKLHNSGTLCYQINTLHVYYFLGFFPTYMLLFGTYTLINFHKISFPHEFWISLKVKIWWDFSWTNKYKGLEKMHIVPLYPKLNCFHTLFWSFRLIFLFFDEKYAYPTRLFGTYTFINFWDFFPPTRQSTMLHVIKEPCL